MGKQTDLAALHAKQELLRARLREYLYASPRRHRAVSTAASSPLAGDSRPSGDSPDPVEVDVVITPAEVNYRHGTGALVRTMFGEGEGILSIRSIDYYQGEHEFGQWNFRLAHPGLWRPQTFADTLQSLERFAPRRVFCVPYHADEVLTALAIRETFDVPMAAHLMDDGNKFVDLIPDELMREFLEKCSVRLAIGPQMRDVYEAKYGLSFGLLPPLVAPELIRSEPIAYTPNGLRGIMVGNVWSADWAERLRDTVREAGFGLDWYGPKQHFMEATDAQFERDGITAHGSVPEPVLAERLAARPYAVVPTGRLTDDDDRDEIGRLSLPSRIVFTMASSNTPIIVMGSRLSAAAQFVEKMGIGVYCDYDVADFKRAVEDVSDPNRQAELRSRAAKLATRFSAEGVKQWLWDALDEGALRKDRYSDLLPRDSAVGHWVEPPIAENIHTEYVDLHNLLRRLDAQGYRPDFVVDVGASDGIWSRVAALTYPDAFYLLIDPVASRYDSLTSKMHLERVARKAWVEAAVSNEVGSAKLRVSDDLYGTSLDQVSELEGFELVETPVTTLEALAREHEIDGRGIVKIDVQCAEHLVIEGAGKFLDQVDVIVAEISMVRFSEEGKTASEMIAMLDGLGFRLYDDAGYWRSPQDGTLLQTDYVFVRDEILQPESAWRPPTL